MYESLIGQYTYKNISFPRNNMCHYFLDAMHTCTDFTVLNYTGHACESYKFYFNYPISLSCQDHKLIVVT